MFHVKPSQLGWALVVVDSITISTIIQAAPPVVWKTLAVDREAWWPELKLAAVEGAPVVETWTEGGIQMTATGEVTRVERDRLLEFIWTEPGWPSSLVVEFRLTPEGSASHLTITESGFARLNARSSLPVEHEQGWHHHTTRLKRECERSLESQTN